MKIKYYILFINALLLLQSCNSVSTVSTDELIVVDSVELEIENIVNEIIVAKDSLVAIPSLRFAKGENETYTAKMYGKNQVTQLIREEQISNTVIIGRDYYYNNGDLVFIKEEGSIFNNTIETYTEKLMYFKEGLLYKAYEKHQFSEDLMFEDSLFKKRSIDISKIDLEKPYRALQQKGEFTMYFDQFLLIDPQSYLIVENNDKSINAALYIIEGDSLLNVLFENPDLYKGEKLWVYHSFKEMNSIERMIYEGSVLIPIQF